MKKILCVLGLAMLPWTSVSALDEMDLEGVFPPLPPVESALPDTLETDEPPAASETPAAVDDETPPGPSKPASPAPSDETYVPALITVTALKQHATACQYWLKLDNRLPFNVRNMALNFTAFIRESDYDKPVLFDVVTRSFSEMRPTDSQYRDVFFPRIQCDDIAFIKVQDAGRCSIGQLTKFSSQSGDCTRYIELQPSDLVCITLDDDTLGLVPAEDDGTGSSPDYPCGRITQAHVDALMARFVDSFEAGDFEGFLALFEADVVLNGERGIDKVREEFGDIFESTDQRAMSIQDVAWETRAGAVRVTIRFHAKLELDYGWTWGHDTYLVEGRFVALLRKDGLAITEYTFDEKDLLTAWPLPD